MNVSRDYSKHIVWLRLRRYSDFIMVAVDMDIHGYIHRYFYVIKAGYQWETPLIFWRLSRLGRLKICAKIIFSAPVASEGIERLSSEARMLLTKQRKRMSPQVMKMLVWSWGGVFGEGGSKRLYITVGWNPRWWLAVILQMSDGILLSLQRVIRSTWCMHGQY